jgi:hypothetical protein
VAAWRLRAAHAAWPPPLATGSHPFPFFNIFLKVLYVYVLFFFIKSDICHLIDTDVMPNELCQKNITKFDFS